MFPQNKGIMLDALVDLSEFSHLPRFPDGRLDYSDSDKCPVLLCFVRFEGRVLLLQRSAKVLAYRKKWGVVAGYIDEPKTLRELALEELQTETGIGAETIRWVRCAQPYLSHDAEVKKAWIVYPVLVELKNTPDIKLDWEHRNHMWVIPDEIPDFDTTPGLYEAFLKLA